jgi:peptidoglycan/xylan/chitin deacetylase (PgdA/CDA1 family)
MSCVVYTCHNVTPLKSGQEERGTISLNLFLLQLRWLQSLGIQFISMYELHSWLQGQNSIPKRAAVLTFDDAYESIIQHVFPHLKQQNIPITIFVIAGFLGIESNLYRRRGGKAHRHLNHEQIISLLQSGLVEVGAHGYHHLNLTRVNKDKLWQEVQEAKYILEDRLNREVPYFAYPYGGTTEAVIQKVKEAGYRLAFTTRKKKLTSKNIDRLRIPRVNWSRRATRFKLGKYFLIPWVRSAG